MLTQYFGFREDPFGATPDPRYLYSSYTHREALASLQYGFYNNRGFTALIAAPGMGKTTLLFSFLEQIRDVSRSVFLFNTQCDPKELISYVLRDIGVIPGASGPEMHEQLNVALAATTRAGQRFVLVIDEAQNLSDAALETVRLLTNFETPRAKLMQIVLAGQPQLSEKLMSPALVQLRQRISNICRIEAFGREETIGYINHRLTVGGYEGPQLFTDGALDRIAEGSRGVPRIINNLCFNALSLCCALKKKRVDVEMVAEAIRDMELPSPIREIPILAPEAPIQESSERERTTKHGSLLSRIRIPVLAALLPFCIVGVIEAARLYVTRGARSIQPPALTAPGSAPVAPQSSPVTDYSFQHASGASAMEVTVESHQTLSDIAVRNLGGFDSDLLHRIQELNPGLTNPNLIQPGQKILLPKHPTSAATESAMTKPKVRELP